MNYQPGPDGVHLEQELRFMRPDGFCPPEELVGLERIETSRATHRDRYFDGQDPKGRPALYHKKCTLRIREEAPERMIATFKQRTSSKAHVGVARLETEAPLEGPAARWENLTASVNSLDHPVFEQVRKVSRGAQLVEMFTVICERTNHVYAGPAGRLVLSEDLITYPDGSQEQRVEIELYQGEPQLLVLADRWMRKQHKGIRAAERGKQGEARRRLAALLSA